MKWEISQADRNVFVLRGDDGTPLGVVTADQTQGVFWYGLGRDTRANCAKSLEDAKRRLETLAQGKEQQRRETEVGYGKRRMEAAPIRPAPLAAESKATRYVFMPMDKYNPYRGKECEIVGKTPSGRSLVRFDDGNEKPAEGHELKVKGGMGLSW